MSATITSTATATTAPPALTTVFTPASTCLIDIWQYSATVSALKCYVGNTQVQCNYQQLGPSQTSNCFPSGWDYESTFYYSPGICPSGYVTACSNVTTSGTATETRATCCPSGYSCQTKNDWPWYSTDPCTYYNPGPVTYVYTSSLPGEGIVTSTVTGDQGFNAYGVEIRFQASDSVTALTATLTSASSATTKTNPSATSISSSASSSAATATATSTSTSAAFPGLSTGAKAGIGVGAAAAGLAVVFGIMFFFVRRRRRSSGSALPVSPASPAYSSELAAIPAKQEIHGSPLSELPNESRRVPVEME